MGFKPSSRAPSSVQKNLVKNPSMGHHVGAKGYYPKTASLSESGAKIVFRFRKLKVQSGECDGLADTGRKIVYRR